MDRTRKVIVPVLQEIHVPERKDADLVVVAHIDPEVLLQPVQHFALLRIEIGSGVRHDETDATGCIVHMLVVGRVRFRHHLSAYQHVRRFEDGIAEILIDTANGQLCILGPIYILHRENLADGILFPEMGYGECLAHHATVPGDAPVGFVAGHEVITEHFEESAVGGHRAAIDTFAADGITDGLRHHRHAAAFLDLREVVLQVLVQPIGHGDIVIVGDQINPVSILLEGVRGQLTLDIYGQQQHESHRHGEAHEVHRPVQFVLFKEVPERFHRLEY